MTILRRHSLLGMTEECPAGCVCRVGDWITSPADVGGEIDWDVANNMVEIIGTVTSTKIYTITNSILGETYRLYYEVLETLTPANKVRMVAGSASNLEESIGVHETDIVPNGGYSIQFRIYEGMTAGKIRIDKFCLIT